MTHAEPGAQRIVERRLWLALAAVSALLAAELAGGLVAGSLALVSDAGHLLTDAGALGLALYASWRGRRPSTARRTFGHHRTGILVAAVNGAGLVAIAAAIAAAAALRLRSPAPVGAATVVGIGLVALVVNASLSMMLRGAGDELSVRSASLHVAADALAALGVVVSGILVLAAGWTAADPVVSLAIAALIALTAVRLLREAAHILAEGAPRDLETPVVRDLIASWAGIEDVHDLHIWSLDRHHRVLSAHVAVTDRPLTEVTELLRDLESRLCERFGIEHATLQPECPSCQESPPLFCDIGERHERLHVERRRGRTSATTR